MTNFKYSLLFTLIQIVSFVLFVVGLPICAVLAFGGFSKHSAKDGLLHWPRLFWIFDNQEDGTCAQWYFEANPSWSLKRCEFYWTALRNSVNNLRFVPGVSKVGRPLFYRTWFVFGRPFHCKMGWMSNGYPAFSPLGGGRGW